MTLQEEEISGARQVAYTTTYYTEIPDHLRPDEAKGAKRGGCRGEAGDRGERGAEAERVTNINNHCEGQKM